MRNLWRRLTRAHNALLEQTYGPPRAERWPEPGQVVFMVTIDPGTHRAPSLIRADEVASWVSAGVTQGSRSSKVVNPIVAAELIARG